VFHVVLFAVCFLVVGWLLITTPFYILGRRRGVEHAWAAFLPIFGIAIVLFESIGKSGWLSLLVLVPTVGGLVVWIWTAVEVPAHHGRSRWWILALIVPFVSFIGYWFYALTLPHEQDEDEFAFA
jgi:Family of unknown function (DUF5684)